MKLNNIHSNEGIYHSENITIILWCMVASIANLNAGFILGYSSQAQPTLISSGLMTIDLNFIYGCIITLGAMLGGILSGVLMNMFGRRGCNIIVCILMSFGHYMHIIAVFFKYHQIYSAIILLVGRFTLGICVGIFLTSVAIYISEISPPNLRGFCGSFNSIFINLGILLTYLFGYLFIYLDINKKNSYFQLTATYYPLIGIILTLIQIILYYFLPESPSWLASKKMYKSARSESMRLSRKKESVDVEPETTSVNQVINEISIWRNRKFLRPLLATIILMFCQQLAGINVILFNATKIFSTDGDILSAALSTIIIGIVLVISSFFSCFLLHSFNRKTILIAGFSVMGTCLFIIGFYYKFKLNNIALPISMISLYLLFYVCSVGPIPWIVMSEIFNKSLKEKGSSLTALFSWFFAFIVTLSYDPLEKEIETSGIFWFYSFFAFASVAIIHFLIPETRNKTSEEIEQLF